MPSNILLNAWSRIRRWPTSASAAESDAQQWQNFALEAAEAGTWDWNLETGAVVWSEMCCRLFGVDSASFKPSYRAWLERIHPDDRETTDRAIRQVVDRRCGDLELRFRVLHPGRGERWIQALGRVVFDRKGVPTRMRGVSIDTTARHRAELAVQESEERYRGLFEMAPVGIVVIEPETGWIVAANSRAHEMLGYTKDEFSKLRLADVEASLDEGGIKRTMLEVRDSHATVQFETRHRRKDGSIVEALAAAHCMQIGGNSFIYKMWLDITAQKNVERQLALAKVEAERANAAKTQFLAAASHDLRQPVQSLFFFHSAIAAKLAGHPALSLIENMENSLDALRLLLDGLLDISKLHAGTIEVERTSFPVSALFARLESEYRARAAEKGLDFRIVSSSQWVRSDLGLVDRVLRNLLDNAIKYTADGAVLLGCRRQGDSLRLSVVDTGPGIPGHRTEDIFHEFVQLGNPERDRSKGLGLGLAIVRQLSQLLGHPVQVHSRLGHGTSFSVDVALAKPRWAGKRRPRPLVESSPPPTKRLALIVDDEAMVLVAMRAMMEAMGWDVLAAGSGQEAIRLVASRRVPDVVVADYRLHDGETGLTVIRQLQENCGVSVPAIVLTGDTSPERMVECQKSGFRLLHKPIAPQELRLALAEADSAA